MSSQRCTHAGCSGSYGPEGYCDECGRKAAAPVSVATAPSRATRGSSRSRGATRGGLGAGLIELPRVPLRDAATAVMSDPQVAERRRFCTSCDKPVGRGKDGKPGRVEGFCPHCGTAYSFLPRLSPGDEVDGRYEVLGALAYGGLGWIYLARDRNVSDTVSDRWVVLKGLINTADPDAVAAAVTERRYLVEIDHPNIVKIHDFVQHPDPKTGVPVGYIVMEYVGGHSLRDLLVAQREQGGPRALPLADVLAYGVEILPALGYLHERGLLFCDFKPDNVIHAEEQLKLIDLGAVRRADDEVSAVYGTPGYQAPEVARAGPSVAADIYTVGRSLAVLSFDFTGFASTYADRLPERAEVPLLAAEESYARLLERATHRDPDRRFQSAAEMSEQSLGVLREVLAAADGVPRPTVSRQFTPERRAFGTGAGEVPLGAPLDPKEIAAALPLPTLDVLDAGAAFLATLTATEPGRLVEQLATAPVRTPEVVLRLARARLDGGDLDEATAELDAAAEADPYDWRVDWHRGLVHLAAGRAAQARVAFDGCYSELPGEPAARLALAAAMECTGDAAAAERLYDRVWRVDRGFISAAFGLARLRAARGDRTGAQAALDEVPGSSNHHLTAQVAAVRAHLPADEAQGLIAAAGRLERLGLDVARQARLTVEMLEAALAWVTAGHALPPDARLLGYPLTERGLRFGLERAYRTLAQLADDRPTRIALVDQANAVRPRTLV